MRLTWIPELAAPGRLAVCRAPGSEPPTPDSTGTLAAELAAVRGQGIDHVVCLLEDEEFTWFHHDMTAAGYVAAVASAGLTLRRAPVEDYTAPPADLLAELVEDICARLAAGEGVLVHCMAGRGRAGTVAAAVLIAEGMKPAEAVTLVRWVRPGAIQSADQEALLLSLR